MPTNIRLLFMMTPYITILNHLLVGLELLTIGAFRM